MIKKKPVNKKVVIVIKSPGNKEKLQKYLNQLNQKKIIEKKLSSQKQVQLNKKNKAGAEKQKHVQLEKLRVNKDGSSKRLQLNSFFKKILVKHPTLIKDFLEIYGKVRIFGFAQKKGMQINYFNPKDNSMHHDHLYKVSIKGKTILFVKVVKHALPPTDAVSQYALHNVLLSTDPILKKWGCKMLSYSFAYNGKSESFLVAPFQEGVLLEKWLSNKKANKSNDVYQRFLKVERFLKTTFDVRDLSPRNVIYNPKKNELVVIDLMHGKK
ncbi:MAG: hypothetical protein PHX27_04230 [Candidatus ainarchaeum sp.]|nr:hypothetical protein [Candidatus ainarchaeum sp.]